jgi:hypothetical protein
MKEIGMMSLTFSQVKPIGPGAWIAPLPPNDARRFGQNPPSKGGRSVIGIEAPKFEIEAGTLSASFDAIFTLNVGESEEAVFIDLRPQEVVTTVLPEIEKPIISPSDKEFIAACQVHLPESMTGIISRVLQEVRKHHDDKLTEGEGRKWTTGPLNFLAITIQNQKKQFLVSVKADPSKYSFRHIHLKRSRPPYCEFHLNSPSQIDEAIRIIHASAEYGSTALG